MTRRCAHVLPYPTLFLIAPGGATGPCMPNEHDDGGGERRCGALGAGGQAGVAGHRRPRGAGRRWSGASPARARLRARCTRGGSAGRPGRRPRAACCTPATTAARSWPPLLRQTGSGRSAGRVGPVPCLLGYVLALQVGCRMPLVTGCRKSLAACAADDWCGFGEERVELS